jgi:hypothetical protein
MFIYELHIDHKFFEKQISDFVMRFYNVIEHYKIACRSPNLIFFDPTGVHESQRPASGLTKN